MFSFIHRICIELNSFLYGLTFIIRSKKNITLAFGYTIDSLQFEHLVLTQIEEILYTVPGSTFFITSSVDNWLLKRRVYGESADASHITVFDSPVFTTQYSILHSVMSCALFRCNGKSLLRSV